MPSLADCLKKLSVRKEFSLPESVQDRLIKETNRRADKLAKKSTAKGKTFHTEAAREVVQEYLTKVRDDLQALSEGRPALHGPKPPRKLPPPKPFDADGFMDKYMPQERELTSAEIAANPLWRRARDVLKALGVNVHFVTGSRSLTDDPSKHVFLSTEHDEGNFIRHVGDEAGHALGLDLESKAFSEEEIAWAIKDYLRSYESQAERLMQEASAARSRSDFDALSDKQKQDIEEKEREARKWLSYAATVRSDVGRARREAVSHLIGHAFLQPKFLAELEDHNKTLWQKIVAAVQRFFAGIKGRDLTESEQKLLEEFKGKFEEAKESERAPEIQPSLIHGEAPAENVKRPVFGQTERQTQAKMFSGMDALAGQENLPGMDDMDRLPESLSDDQPTTTNLADQTKYPVVEYPIANLSLSKDVPQFKSNANERGIVEGEELGGDYNRLGTGAIIVWERSNGKGEVITGRHRFDLAKRKGLDTIPAQVVREADGFTKEMAAVLDAEANIRDGQGKVEDYVSFFRTKRISEEHAKAQGLLQRSQGRDGFAIGVYAGDDLYAGWRGKKVSTEKAAAIADAARNNDGLQVAALTKAKELSADELRGFIRLLEANPSKKKQSQGDLFGFDESFLKESVGIAKAAGRIIDAKRDRINAVLGALRRPETAKEMGLSGDMASIQAEVDRLRADLAEWQHWTTNPALAAQARAEYEGKSEPKTADSMSEAEIADYIKQQLGVAQEPDKPKGLKEKAAEATAERQAAADKFMKAAKGKLFTSATDENEPLHAAPGPVWRDNILDALATWQFKGTRQQLLKHLEKTKGAMDEAKWIGLPEFLNEGKIYTKADIEKFVRENRVDVREVAKEDAIRNYNDDDLRRMVKESTLMNGGGSKEYSVVTPDGSVLAYNADTPEEAIAMARRNMARPGWGGAETKFSQYTLPGGENYRELLLTLPLPEAKRAWEVFDPKNGSTVAWVDTEEDAKKRVADNPSLDYSGPYAKGANIDAMAFRSSHFDEPNILAHVRFNERTDADGKRVLFIEEAQSDWAQTGRKEGFQGADNGYASASKEAEKYLESIGLGLSPYSLGWLFENPEKGRNIERFVALSNKFGNDTVLKLREQHQTQSPRAVPNMPFKTTWPMLAMKRMIRWAAEHGFDKVAWTTGEQQAERYDLGKQVQNILHVPFSDGSHAISILAKDHNDEGMDLSRVGQRIQKDAAGRQFYHIADDKLDDLIGKETAEKLRKGMVTKETTYKWQGGETPIEILSGDGLRVGGEGMRGFYDKILPAEVNKFVKKWGGKVGETLIRNKQSLKPFQNGEDGPWFIYDPITEDTVSADAMGVSNSANSLEFDSEAEARAFIKSRGKSGGTPVHSLDLTPAMKQAASEGMPLFAAPDRSESAPNNDGLQPELLSLAADYVAKSVKAGYYNFRLFLDDTFKEYGSEADTVKMRRALRAAWNALRPIEPRMDEAKEADTITGENLEQAAEQEILPTSDDLTSIKKAIVNDLRGMVGLPEMEGSTPQAVAEWAETARITLEADPKAALRLLNELASNKARPINQQDAMLLQFHYRQLANKLKPVVDQYFAAVAEKDPVAISVARTAVINARKEMTDFEETIHPSKETWGRTGVALQQLLRRDFSLEAVLRRGQEANHGEDLSEVQVAELTNLTKQLEALQKQFDEQRKRMDDLEAKVASQKQHDEAVKDVQRRKVQRKSERRVAAEKAVADAWAEFAKATVGRVNAGVPIDLLPPAVKVAKAYIGLGYVRFAEFMASVKQNTKAADEALFRRAWEIAKAEEQVVEPSLDAADLAGLTKEARRIQRSLVESGMRDRDQVIDAVHQSLKESLPEFTRRQTMDALSGYGQFKTQSQDEISKLIRDMNAEVLKLSQLDQMEIALKRVEELRARGMTDEEIGNALANEKLLVEATGLVRDRPTDTVRQLTKKYNELKKGIPATSEGQAGLLQTAVAAIERSLTNRIADLNWEIEHKERIVKDKRERPSTERIKELEVERDALLKIHREMFPPKRAQLTPEQRIANAMRAADKAIAQLEQQLQDKDFDQAPRSKLSSPELDAKRARLEQLRAARKSAKEAALSEWEGEGGGFNDPNKRMLTPDERARRSYESSLRKRIADATQFLADGDFSPKPKKAPRTLSDSELKLKRQMEDLRQEILKKFGEYHLANLHGIAWGADKIAEVAHLSRALMTSFDMSGLLRQGGLVAMGHPLMAKNALLGTINSIAHSFDKKTAFTDFQWTELERFLSGIDSRQAEFDFMHKLTEGPAGEFRQRAGLNLPSSDEKITRQEEAFQGRWGKYIPGIAISSRLYTMVLNKLRADLFDSMVQNLGRGGQVSMDEAKLIAGFVNVATGRSDLGRLNGWAAVLNTVFFAPRYVASRFQYLAMPFYLPFQGGIKQNWRVKAAIYQEFGRTYAGIGLVLGLFALLGMLLYDDDDKDKPKIELDPRSSDFLKVRMGDTRLDFLAGLSQVIVLSSRLISGQTKSSVSGKVRNFGEGYKPETRMSVLGRFGRTKLAPVPGTVATIADNWTDVVGQKQTPISLAASMVLPLSLRDVKTTMEAQGVPKGTAFSLLSILGVGMNTYGPKTEYMTGTAEDRKAQIDKDLDKMEWDTPDKPSYSEFLSSDQLKKFRDRKMEKRGAVIKGALHHLDRKKHSSDKSYADHVVQREKNRERLVAMKAEGVSLSEAVAILTKHPDSKGKEGLTTSYFKAKAALKKFYATGTFPKD